ncbi:TonB-dependent receptor [Sphingomonas jatrophae]|uniref:Iron complex outermembrane recepter protein n=1 Tax=Sphingomonas jatrophae TaxID=1166337 RepID=A0A1I6LD70_9SPHN|nr:TonB-dependent receptor [Sphingomonas jatrophae]SFS01180.1 iron complex outermembrane recepter protein [Sphingomonas jatrophae]
MFLLLASTAAAALQPAEAPAPVTTPAAPALSPISAGAAANQAGEIVVTARRRVENVQDVPIAVSVVSGLALEQTGSYNINRLQQLQPTLQFFSTNPRNSSINIRGLGAPLGLTNDGIEQGVGIYIDQVYYNRVAASTLDFVDVEQVEVLRGPQGTLYGKNTVAGAINITTRAPSFEPEARAEVSIGNYNFKQGKASVSGPLSDTLAARISVAATDRAGTIRNVVTSQRVNSQDNLGLRGTLLWKPTERLNIFLAGDYNVQDPVCCAQIYVRYGPTQRAANRQYPALVAAYNAANPTRPYRVPSTDAFDRLTDLDAPLAARNEHGGASLRAEWDVGGGTVTSVSAYRYWDWDPSNDRDFTGLAVNPKVNNPTDQKQYTQEFRYAISSKRFDLVAGAFGFHQTIRTRGIQTYGRDASLWLLAPSSALSRNPAVLDGLQADNDIRLNNTSAAVFGKLTWRVTDRLSIAPGIRVNYDKKRGQYDSVVTGTASNGVRQRVTFASTDPWIVAQRGVQAPQFFRANFSDWNLSYDLNLSYKVADDVLAYATYARSFKSGGVNLNGVPNDAAGVPQTQVATVDPEKVDHFELGLKTQFWDRRATLNLTGYWTDVHDYQAIVNDGSTSVLRGYLANAKKARTRGVEADFSVRPNERVNAYLNGAYTDATYEDFKNAPCPPELSGGTIAGAGQTPGAAGVPGALSPAVCDISGQWLPGVSKWSLSYGAEVNLPTSFLTGEGGQFYLGWDGSYRTKFSSNASRSIYTDIAGYSVNNLRAGFRNADGLNVYGWVRNIFDKDYYEVLATTPGNTGLIAGQPADPRTYGVTLAARF